MFGAGVRFWWVSWEEISRPFPALYRICAVRIKTLNLLLPRCPSAPVLSAYFIRGRRGGEAHALQTATQQDTFRHDCSNDSTSNRDRVCAGCSGVGTECGPSHSAAGGGGPGVRFAPSSAGFGADGKQASGYRSFPHGSCIAADRHPL